MESRVRALTECGHWRALPQARLTFALQIQPSLWPGFAPAALSSRSTPSTLVQISASELQRVSELPCSAALARFSHSLFKWPIIASRSTP